MLVTLYVMGKFVLSCLSMHTGTFCTELFGDPAVIILAGGFEYIGEFLGIHMYRKKIKKEDS